MNIHEFQAKPLLSQYGIPVPRGGVASTVQQAADIAQQIGGNSWVIKAQIHAGGRRAGHFQDRPDAEGGVRMVSSLDEMRHHAGQMLGHVLVTEQTGPVGRQVKHVYVEQACEVQSELYLGMLVDRKTSRVTLIASHEGGIKIESVAARSPASILKVAVDPREGLAQQSANKIALALGVEVDEAEVLARVMHTMYQMFVDLDASLIEINPLAITRSGEILALDATLTFDDNALFRHEEIRALRDEDELRVGELEAVRHGLNYVKLDGNIGLMASGAGLALATLDAIKLYGGEPANFLDIPPVAQVQRVKGAVQLILSDPNVESVLVNVFGGGIMRCDTIADAFIMTNRETPIRVPIIARLAGTNAEFAVRRLKDAGPPITFAQDMADAAEKAVKAASETKQTTRRTWWDRAQDVLVKRPG